MPYKNWISNTLGSKYTLSFIFQFFVHKEKHLFFYKALLYVNYANINKNEFLSLN